MQEKLINPVSSPKPRLWHSAWLLIALLLVLQACTTSLISNYDEQTDQAVTALQRKFETFFIELESQIGTDKADYKNYEVFYKEAKVDISAIKLRASALSNNKITLEQVDLLEKNLGILETLHKDGIAAIELVAIIRQDFNTALSNILRLELAKKHGEKEKK